MLGNGWPSAAVILLCYERHGVRRQVLMSDAIMTRQGYEELKERLRRLKSVDRQEVIQEIAAAAAHGDLSENAEYDAAKEKQGFLESRIRDMEKKLANATVIDPARLTEEKVVFGATVVLEDIDRGTQVTYQIVGADEADVTAGKVSIASPIARALIGREEGDCVEVRTPGGLRSYELLEIQYI